MGGSENNDGTTAKSLKGYAPSLSPLPSMTAWAQAAEIDIVHQTGETTKFGKLVAPNESTDTVLIIFIRHFFCGLCQDYIRSLSPTLTPETLLARRTRLIIIGCGSTNVIQNYIDTTGTTFPIYTDPTRSIYKTLRMTRTLVQPSKLPEYAKTGPLEMFVKAFKYSIGNVMKTGKIWESGDIAQIGGEWIVEDGELVWCHLMHNTADHLDVGDLWKVLTSKDEHKLGNMAPGQINGSVAEVA